MLKNLTETTKILEVTKDTSKTGFEQSLEGEQVWPPKAFKIVKDISDYDPLIPFSGN